jgi:hypothetical protein
MRVKRLGPGYRLTYKGRVYYCMRIAQGVRLALMSG